MKKQHTIGFYNIENLFDIIDDPDTLDEAFTPDSPKRWTAQRYENKLHKLAKAIKLLGDEDSVEPPVILGLAEVENKSVLEDLTQKTELQQFQYGIVHFDSPDERGIDVGFIYQKEAFMVLHKESHSVYLEDEKGIQDTTRDILHVSGLLKGMPLDIIVTHWPSKRNGDVNAQKRLVVADKVRSIVDTIFDREPGANLLVMGDFNDDPDGKSLKRLKIEDEAYKMDREELFNPMIELEKEGKGSLSHKGHWNLFDQILVSKALIRGQRSIQFKKADVFDPRLLQEWKEPYKGEPFRTYVGKKYLGGYSDHFPVYIVVDI
ncbi:hypothetical protein UJ101_01367 [Flavobacteriaceae bacterium UJ101]|nr:hypothetical protein UJ101_01367 [Flavobacteriaceae bacterium UJ101]